MKKLNRILSVIAVIAAILVTCIACGDKTYTVTFIDDSNNILATYKTTDTITYPQDTDDYYYTWSETYTDFSVLKEDVTIVGIKHEKAKIYTITYQDSNGNILKTQKSNETPVYPEDPENAVYHWDLVTNTFLIITEDTVITGTLIKNQIEYIYIIDGVTVKNETLDYDVESVAPSYDDTTYATSKWVASYNDDESVITYTLRYTLKKYNINYYYGDESLECTPAKYTVGSTVTLPTPTKTNYSFVGWYMNDISLYHVDEITSDMSGDINLYARFIETSKVNKISLPKATDHFTGIKKIQHSVNKDLYVYQPIFPTNSSIQLSSTLYTWTTSDSNIATVSEYSSITAKSAGYCILTATLKADSSITLNCVIKVTSEGVEFSSVEEANTITLCKVTFIGKDGETLKEEYVQKDGTATYPYPCDYEGYAFVGWDKECYGITEDTVITATYKQEVTNKYVGKKVAIIGDSISTYNGYIPEGYATFYPYPTADVNDVNQTWWMQVINKLGAGLWVDNSYSGSCVGSGDTKSDSQYMSRLEKLLIQGVAPDVIIIYMGSNDCQSRYVSFDSFNAAYKVMLQNIQKLCPKAEIILCPLVISKFYTEENRVMYNNAIKGYAEEFKCTLIPTDEVDVSNYLVDSGHPNRAGHTLMADFIVSHLVK